MRVGEHEAGTHPLERVDPEHAPIEHPLVDEDRALSLRSHGRRDAAQIGRKARPDAGLDRRDLPPDVLFDDVVLLALDHEILSGDLGLDAEPLEHKPRHAQMLRHRILDGGRTLRHRDERDQRADLHVVTQDRVIDALQPLDAVDRDRVRPDPDDARTHLHQRHAELLHMGLAGRVVQHGPPLREHRREKRVLRRGHRSFVKDDLGAAQACRRQDVTIASDLEVGAELLQRQEVRVVTPPADHIAAGESELDLLHPREEGSREEERGADLARELLRDRERARRSGDPYRVVVELLDRRAEGGRDLEHAADVADPRNVVKGDGLVGEQAGRDQREGLVLVACRCDLTV